MNIIKILSNRDEELRSGADQIQTERVISP